MVTYVLHLSLWTRMIFAGKNPLPSGVITRLFAGFFFPNIIRLSFSTCSFRILSIRQFRRSSTVLLFAMYCLAFPTYPIHRFSIIDLFIFTTYMQASLPRKLTNPSLPAKVYLPSIILSYILFILNDLSWITANEAYKNYFETQTIIDNHDKKNKVTGEKYQRNSLGWWKYLRCKYDI